MRRELKRRQRPPRSERILKAPDVPLSAEQKAVLLVLNDIAGQGRFFRRSVIQYKRMDDCTEVSIQDYEQAENDWWNNEVKSSYEDFIVCEDRIMQQFITTTWCAEEPFTEENINKDIMFSKAVIAACTYMYKCCNDSKTHNFEPAFGLWARDGLSILENDLVANTYWVCLSRFPRPVSRHFGVSHAVFIKISSAFEVLEVDSSGA